MLAQLQWLTDRIRVNPRTTRLRWWLAGSEVVIVLLVAGGLSLYAGSRLRQGADAQGIARVQLGGAMARETLRRMHEDTQAAARNLAENSVLLRALASQTGAASALKRICQTPTDACAVFDGTTLAASAGSALPWDEILLEAANQGPMFFAAPLHLNVPLFGATAPIPERTGMRVFVVRPLDAPLARDLGHAAGLSLGIINYRDFVTAPVDAETSLHTAGLADGVYAVARIDALDLYAASFPIYTSGREAIALLEARLPAAQIDSEIRGLIRRLLLTALVLALLAVAAGLVLSSFIAVPIQALTNAATRLRNGDFSTSIPVGGTAEVAALGNTMEDMRRNLVELTGTLRRREGEARAVLTGIVEGVFAVDRERRIRYLNPQAANLLGVHPPAVIGRFCGDVLRPRDQKDGTSPCERNCPILQARARGSAQCVEHLDSGMALPHTTVITSSSAVEGLQVQVIRDETSLEAARRARDSVLANISHEFRTPLAAQLASIELLREGLTTLDRSAALTLVQSLERGTQRLTRLIDNLLESVRIESGQLSIRRQDVDLAEVIADAEALVGSLLVQRQQRLEISLPEELPLVSGDSTRLTQVFVNLMANANKYAPEGSTLYIGATATADTVTAWVDDEGPGVADTAGSAIFERFQRGTVAEPEPGGLGLGLWIVKSIIERHGGTIGMTRTGEGRTRFTLTLPLATPTQGETHT